MQLHVIHTGNFKLDGGAMFGVVPKTIWNRLNPSDDNNLCTWAMRCLLIEDGDRLILLDNGIGDKQSEKFFSYYHLHGDQSLTQSIQHAGFSNNDITDVFLTHLHFDHCGGGVERIGDALVPTFKKARYWSNSHHWDWAVHPNPRERASFLSENLMPMQQAGQLEFTDHHQDEVFPQFDILHVSGHTDHMMIPKIKYKDKVICFVSDLLPSSLHIPLPYIMAYDVQPLLTMREKEDFLNEAAQNQYILFLEHDPIHECCTVKQTEKGVRLDQTFSLHTIL